jgi:hypothetical protein
MTSQEQDELAVAYESARKLLAQTRDYLLRLPPVPATHDLARRIDAHLHEPAGVPLRRALAKAVSDTTQMNWGRFMPNGEPFLNANLRGRTLSLWSPHLSRRERAAQAVVLALEHGLVVSLTPARPVPAGVAADSGDEVHDWPPHSATPPPTS